MYGSEMMFVEASSQLSPIFGAIGGVLLAAFIGIVVETDLLSGVRSATEERAARALAATSQNATARAL